MMFLQKVLLPEPAGPMTRTALLMILCYESFTMELVRGARFKVSSELLVRLNKQS